jgi:hypothetical protein
MNNSTIKSIKENMKGGLPFSTGHYFNNVYFTLKNTTLLLKKKHIILMDGYTVLVYLFIKLEWRWIIWVHVMSTVMCEIFVFYFVFI